MDPKTMFAKALKQATAMVSIVDPEQLSNSTPCTEWDLGHLLGHLFYELAWVPDIAEGKTIEEVGNKYDHDLMGEDLKASWQKLAAKAQKVVNGANPNQIAHLSYADVPLSQYLQEISGDLLIHSWDVGQAISCTLLFDKDLAKAIYSFSLPRADEYDKSGLFGPRPSVPPDADIEIKLLAFFGREVYAGKWA